MGIHTTTIGNHQLNTSSVIALAQDLAQRLYINIEYGYSNWGEYEDLLGNRELSDWHRLGQVVSSDSCEWFTLDDTYYESKIVYSKIGEKLFDHPDFETHINRDQPRTEFMAKCRRAFFRNTYIFQRKNDGYHELYIYNECYTDHQVHTPHFYLLGDCFTQDLESVRLQIEKYLIPLGGDKVYFIPDTCSVFSPIGEGDECEMTWKELEAYIYEKGGDLIFDFSSFPTSASYSKSYFNLKYKPICFVDDYGCMRSDASKRPLNL